MDSNVPKYDQFTVNLNEGVAILAYNRPRTGNSLHATVAKALLDATKWAVANPAVRVIVQTGTGKFFSTGRDMGDDGGESDLDETLQVFKELNDTLINCPKLLIAAVNGPAVGYGVTSLALYDLVYSVPEAYFFTPFTKWALCPEGCSSVTFSSIMGHQKAAALLLAGERMMAHELWVAGLVTKVIPASTNAAFMEEVLKVAHRIAGYPPVALAACKRLMEGDRRWQLLAANEKECNELRVRLEHHECADAVLSFAREQQEKKAKRKDSRL